MSRTSATGHNRHFALSFKLQRGWPAGVVLLRLAEGGRNVVESSLLGRVVPIMVYPHKFSLSNSRPLSPEKQTCVIQTQVCRSHPNWMVWLNPRSIERRALPRDCVGALDEEIRLRFR